RGAARRWRTCRRTPRGPGRSRRIILHDSGYSVRIATQLSRARMEMTPPQRPSNLLSKAARGAAWTILTGMGARALGLLATLWLTYYLNPDVQGEVSDAFIVVLTAHQITTFGVAQYLVANPRSGREVAWHVTAFQFILGVLAFGTVVALRNHFGGMLDAPTM